MAEIQQRCTWYLRALAHADDERFRRAVVDDEPGYVWPAIREIQDVALLEAVRTRLVETLRNHDCTGERGNRLTPRFRTTAGKLTRKSPASHFLIPRSTGFGRR